MACGVAFLVGSLLFAFGVPAGPTRRAARLGLGLAVVATALHYVLPDEIAVGTFGCLALWVQLGAWVSAADEVSSAAAATSCATAQRISVLTAVAGLALRLTTTRGPAGPFESSRGVAPGGLGVVLAAAGVVSCVLVVRAMWTLEEALRGEQPQGARAVRA